MSMLVNRQALFSSLLGQFLVRVTQDGYRVTMGECWRNPVLQQWYIEQGKSWTPHSRHLIRLAVDLNLIKSDGTVGEMKDDYAPLGAIWKSLDPDCVWGGDWTQVDACHFELRLLGGTSV